MLAHPRFHLSPDFFPLFFSRIRLKSFEERVLLLGDHAQLPGFPALVRRPGKPKRVNVRILNMDMVKNRFALTYRRPRSCAQKHTLKLPAMPAIGGNDFLDQFWSDHSSRQV